MASQSNAVAQSDELGDGEVERRGTGQHAIRLDTECAREKDKASGLKHDAHDVSTAGMDGVSQQQVRSPSGDVLF